MTFYSVLCYACHFLLLDITFRPSTFLIKARNSHTYGYLMVWWWKTFINIFVFTRKIRIDNLVIKFYQNYWSLQGKLFYLYMDFHHYKKLVDQKYLGHSKEIEYLLLFDVWLFHTKSHVIEAFMTPMVIINYDFTFQIKCIQQHHVIFIQASIFITYSLGNCLLLCFHCLLTFWDENSLNRSNFYTHFNIFWM